ncbi:E3 ubiquitin-protein ligase RNF135 [Pezoporus wallicus]|uniref:E3 ubiquitin-protein ligase RNF135 n=1 Tax=Pezoporus wallicus TaxID=35540 RepID=UPI00254F8906|nr:E3 ubiquitin-protein ligase RNF135 [Pezoporus wallicus]XP_061311338.1 E3 ubiquitin-protein ligase RNF135 [Pezoporus flaviventris]
MAAAVPLGRLLRAVELSCACCLQHFADPVRLAVCGHSFCRPCVLQYCKGKQRAVCPLCREGFELKDLRPNRELAALVNLVQQEVKEEELEAQNEPKLSAAVACNDQSSAGSRHRDKEEEIQDISKEMEATIETIHLLREELSKTKEYTSQIKNQITRDFSCMKEYVERQERHTLVFIEQEQKAAEEKIEETIQQLCIEVNRLADITAETSTLPERHRYRDLPSIMDKITLDEKLNVVKSAVEVLKRKLEILLLEKYPEQLTPVEPPDLGQETSACSLSPESAVKSPEPVNSSRFSQWADDVTFDLRRVYERLAITAQNRKVMVSSHPTDYGPSPNRFCISQVMCSQSFSTGCHYWEVITKDSDGWAVGVAHKMIGKREKLGRTEHSWCVEWLGPRKQLSAWHRNQETLLHKDKPLKVGVFLELQKKTVSFYSITDKEMLLHTFEISTSNPLYPAFWLYGLEINGSLTISHTNGT